MVSSARVAIIDQDPDARYQVQQLVTSLGFAVVAQAGVGTEGVSAVIDANPEIVLCGFKEPVARVAQTVESIAHATTDVPVIAYAPDSSLELVRRAMSAGARDFLPSPLKPEDLKRALHAALEAGERRRLRDAAGRPMAPEGAIITVFGAKGGIGKTTVAVNLAVALVQEAGQKVLLVDADDTFGDSAAALSLQPGGSVTDLLRLPESADGFEKLLAYHESGLAVAAGPQSPFEWRGTSVEQLRQLLWRVARQFDVVVVDTAGTLSEVSQAALEAASMVLWVTTPEYASVRDTLQALQAIRQLRVPEDRIRFVLNVTSIDSEASPSSVQEALGHELFWIVPYDAQARRSAQLGRALIGEKKSPAAKTLTNLARALSGLPGLEKRRRFFRRRTPDRSPVRQAPLAGELTEQEVPA